MSGASDLLGMRKERLRTARLYAILDMDYASRREDMSPLELAKALLRGGADILQLRAKHMRGEELVILARELRIATREHHALFIVNDHPELAREVDADGVHVGQDDLAVSAARRVVGDKCVVGKSTHSLSQAIAAEDEGADYIGVGPLYATPTKPDYVPVGLPLIAQVQAAVAVPQFCIGGVNATTLHAVLLAGAKAVVCVSALLMAEDPETETHQLKLKLMIQEAGLDGSATPTLPGR